MTLSLRLAVMFALVSALLLGAIGIYLYQSLQREIVWRDDQALVGRLARIQAIIQDSDSLNLLSQRPQLYENMLGNRDNLLWVLDQGGQPIIQINPPELPIPMLSADNRVRLLNWSAEQPTRLALQSMPYAGQRLTLIAGKLLLEREQMLTAYRFNIGLSVLFGTLLAFGLGWLVSLRGLRPVRQLAVQASQIDVQQLHVRLTPFSRYHELVTLSESLNQMLSRLENGFMQLSRFSEDLAHEMRTPLNNLMGQTSLALQQDRSLDDYQTLLCSNQEEYERLARMIDNMLFLARTSQANAAAMPELVELAVLVAQLCEYFEGMAEDRQITLINQSSGQLWAEPSLLRRAVANLLANAVRHADQNTAIIIASQSVGDTTELSVCNQGTLIAADQLELIFERFYRCDASRQHAGESGGLGLAIVRSIMQLHHGRVRVSSTAQRTCFSLIFPTKPANTRDL